MSTIEPNDLVKAIERRNLTHEQAADIFVATATGKAAGLSREELIKSFRETFPSRRALAAHMRGFLTIYNAGKAPVQQR